MGRRKRPFYRIVAVDSRTRRDGPEIEKLGWFNPLNVDIAVELNEDRIMHWLSQGAIMSEKVQNIFSSTGLQYKMHLKREGKTDEQIAAALTEWKLGKESRRLKLQEKKMIKKDLEDSSSKISDEDSEEAAPEEAKAEKAAPEEAKAEEAAPEEAAADSKKD